MVVHKNNINIINNNNSNNNNSNNTFLELQNFINFKQYAKIQTLLLSCADSCTISKNQSTDKPLNLNQLFSNGLSPLHLAVAIQDEYLVRLFLENGVNVNIVNRKGDTVLNYIMTTYNDQTDKSLCIFKIILKAVDVDPNRRDSFNLTPLEAAIRFHKLTFLKLLLQQRNVNVQFKTKCGDTILHLANLYPDDDILRILLLNYIDPEMVNQQCKTALQVAIEFRKLTKIKILLEYSAQFDYRQNYVKLLFMDLIRTNDKRSIVFLIYHIVKRHPNDLDALMAISEYQKFMKPFVWELKKMQTIEIGMNSRQTFYNFLTYDFSTSSEFFESFEQQRRNVHCKSLYFENKPLIFRTFPLFAEILIDKFDWMKNKGIFYELVYRNLLINSNIEHLIQLPVNIFRKIVTLINTDEFNNL